MEKTVRVNSMVVLLNRLNWIDALKGFAILTVVYLHVYNGYDYEGTMNWYTIKWIASYHMPLFFVCAGYFFEYNINAYEQKVLNKVKNLMVPYAVWGIVIGFFVENIRLLFRHVDMDILQVLIRIITGRTSYMACWFLMVLFGVYLVEYFIDRIIKRISNTRIHMIMLFAIHIGLLFTGYFLDDSLLGELYYFRRILISVFFFWFGYILKRIMALNYKVSHSLIFAIILIFIGGG